MNKKNIKLAILSISSIMMISMTASAILADIQAYFVGIDESLIQMVLTLPALMGLVFSFASGPLSMKISKKNLVYFGLVCGLSGGIIALFLGSTSIFVLLGCSLLVGISQGINATMSMALIAEYFDGEEASGLMGLQSAFVNGGSMVLIFTSGLLAGIQWNYSYLVYLLFIPIILIVYKNLPKNQPIATNEQKKSEESKKLNINVYIMAVVLFLFSVFLFVFQTNIALLVISKGLGDAAICGLINAVMSASGMVTGIMFGKIQGFFKRQTIPVAFLIVGIGMLLIFSIGTLPIIFLAAILCGFGLATITPAAIFLAADSVAPNMKAIAIATVTATSSLGMFISPLFINMMMNAMNGDITSKFLISAVGLLAIGVLFILIYGNLRIRKDFKKQVDNEV